MTKAHLDLQNQLEPSSSDLTTQPLFNDSPVLFLEILDQVNAHPSEQVEQTEHTTLSNVHTPPDTTHEVPPPTKKRYEIMKDPVFLSSPVFTPKKHSQRSLSTIRDDHLIALLSQDNFTFEAQPTSLYMHPTDYTFRLMTKTIFSFQFNFLCPSIYDLKTDKSDPSFLSLSQKACHHQTYTKILQHTKPQKYLSSIINTLQHSI